MDPRRVLSIVLAGGKGSRLAPLTADRAKSAVPFGGMYRLIDFSLSNLGNSGCRRICVLTQYKSHSLNRHITTTWRLSSLLGDYVTTVPAQQRLGPHWQTGSADAIYQSLNLIHDDKPDVVAVIGADHVFQMDTMLMVDQHAGSGAGVTIAGIPVPRSQAAGFGVIQAGQDGTTVEAFLEKPAAPPPRPGSPGEACVSMGIYIFTTEVLVEALRRDAADTESRHHIGENIVPMLVREGRAGLYDFQENFVPGADPLAPAYWREMGTLDAYFDAHMDLCVEQPAFDLYNDRWPILAGGPAQPPAKFEPPASFERDGGHFGCAINSVVSSGVIVSGGLVRESVLSPGVRVSGQSRVERSVLLHNTRIGQHAVVQNTILDKNVTVADGARVGIDKEHDISRGFVVSPGGITVVGKGQLVA
jgi:glucose-1-phosphate adenylyltransferase